MNEWQTEPLGKVTTKVQTGSTPSTSRPEFFNGAIDWFTPADIGQTRLLERSSRHISKQGLKEGKARLFEPGMLLVTCIGNIGRVGILTQPASSNQQITALKFSPKIDPNFAYYWFVKNQSELENRASQAVVPILNGTRLKEIPFSYPPIEEQERIAGILARADRLRQLRRTTLQLSAGYLQSVFLQLFGDPVTNPMGWESERLGKLIKLVGGYAFKSEDFVERGIPLVRIGTVNTGRFDDSNLVFLPNEYSSVYERFLLRKGDLVITLTGTVGKGDYGNVCIMGNDFPRYFLNQRVAKINFSSQHFVGEYLWGLFKNPSVKDNLTNISRGIRQANISNDDILRLHVAVPPIEKQACYKQIVQQYGRLRSQQHEAARQADHLFATLLHRAFRGEL